MAGQQPQKYPKVDIRKDPFTQEDQSVLVENEEYTIPAASPFYVQLDEVPRLDDPSSMVVYLTDLLAEDLDASETIVTVEHGSYFNVGDIIQIDDEQMLIGGISSNDLSVTRGYGGTTPATHTNGTRFFLTAAFTEVLTTPTARQYQVHYGTVAIPYKAGLVRFSEDHAGAVVWITYYKTGHYNWAEFVQNSVNENTLALKSFELLAEDLAEVTHEGGTWDVVKTITINTTERDVLLWIEFELRKWGATSGSVPVKVSLDGGSTIYSCGKWTGLAGDYLGEYTNATEDYIAKDNIIPGKFFGWDAAFSEEGNCPLDISGLTPGEHTITVSTYRYSKIRNFRIYSTRL